MPAHLPLDSVLEALVVNTDWQVPTLIELPERGVGWVGPGIGCASFWRAWQALCFDALAAAVAAPSG